MTITNHSKLKFESAKTPFPDARGHDPIYLLHDPTVLGLWNSPVA